MFATSGRASIRMETSMVCWMAPTNVTSFLGLVLTRPRLSKRIQVVLIHYDVVVDSCCVTACYTNKRMFSSLYNHQLWRFAHDTDISTCHDNCMSAWTPFSYNYNASAFCRSFDLWTSVSQLTLTNSSTVTGDVCALTWHDSCQLSVCMSIVIP